MQERKDRRSGGSKPPHRGGPKDPGEDHCRGPNAPDVVYIAQIGEGGHAAMKDTTLSQGKRAIRFKETRDPEGGFHYVAEFVEDPEDTYDPEKDWAAWKQTLESRPRGMFPPSPTPHPGDEAIEAARSAARGFHSVGSGDSRIDASSLTLAAALTTYFAEVEVLFSQIPPLRWDLLVLALNRYPHPLSAACRWLVPALRNFLGEPRESPDDLWREWRREQERILRLTLHPHSVLFTGSPRPRHQLIDLEADPPSGCPSRAQLELWRLRAHLMDVPEVWKFESGVCRELRRPLAVGRLNALTHFAVEAIAARTFPKADTAPIAESFRTFLLREAARESTPFKEKQRLREVLAVLNEAVLRGLVQRSRLSLNHRQVREYESLLRGIQRVWRHTETFHRSERRLQARQDFVFQRGWEDSDRARKLLAHKEIGMCPPREIAALLLCMNEGLGLYHPQTILETLANARKHHEVAFPEDAPKSRRGRPPKTPRI